LDEQINPDPACPPGQLWGFEKTFRYESSPEEIAAMEADYAHYKAVQAHWTQKLYDGLWDEDVPWVQVVPRFQWEEVVLDAIADVIGRAYHAGRRSALGQADAYWQPPAAPEITNKPTEEVLDGF
jgi:hypothetical protein